MKREIKPCAATLEKVSDMDDLQQVADWLTRQGDERDLKWLLAHADDGVIWGRLDAGRVVTSYDAIGNTQESKDDEGFNEDLRSVKHSIAQLRLETLQQARLFGSATELLLWRDGENIWRARVIADNPDAEEKDLSYTECLDEEQILWGTHAKPVRDGFTLMRDGAQGLRHVVPLSLEGKFDERHRPLRLLMRHYLSEDESGFKRIATSRLSGLESRH